MLVSNGKAVTIVQNQQKLVYQLNGEDLTLVGDHNQVIIQEQCGRLAIRGNHNTVVTDQAKRISMVGTHNQVSWHTSNPEVSDVGPFNSVSKQEAGSC